jgi:hypothetical protein
MAGESLVIRQRTFWRLDARRAAAGVRRVRACPTGRRKRVVPPATASRVRISRSVRPRIAVVLREARVIQARLTSALNVYARPEKAGGASLAGDVYAAGAAAGDPRILADALADVADGVARLRTELEAITKPRPTRALPGTSEKLEVMRTRFERFESLHSDNDARRT